MIIPSARIQAVLRRRAAPERVDPPEAYVRGDLAIDHEHRRVTVVGEGGAPHGHPEQPAGRTGGERRAASDPRGVAATGVGADEPRQHSDDLQTANQAEMPNGDVGAVVLAVGLGTDGTRVVGELRALCAWGTVMSLFFLWMLNRGYEYLVPNLVVRHRMVAVRLLALSCPRGGTTL